MLPKMAAPPEVEWDQLSFRSREIVAQVVLRLAAGASRHSAEDETSRANA